MQRVESKEGKVLGSPIKKDCEVMVSIFENFPQYKRNQV